MQKALRALLHDADAEVNRTQEEKELLTWCLAEAYAVTRIPLLREPLRKQIQKIDVRQASPWLVPAAMAVFTADADTEAGREMLSDMREHFPSLTNNLMNQATHLCLAPRAGDLQGARRHLAAVRALRPDKWKEYDAPLQTAVMLTTALSPVGGKDWNRWSSAFMEDTRRGQKTRGSRGWWTAEGLGLPASGMPILSERNRDVYVTSLILLASPPRRFLPSLRPSLGEPDDSPDAGIEVTEL